MSSSPKSIMRRRLLGVRAEAHRAWPDAGRALWARLPPTHRPAADDVVAGYRPIGSEIDPAPLMRALAERGARLALPVTPPRGRARPLDFRLWSPGDPLVRSAFGVDEPTAEAPLITPTLVLAPLLAFDRRGGRLGYGAGHYDRTLADLRARGPVLALGLAFAEQEVDETPADAHDQPLDGVLTPAGFVAAMKENG